ncbi:hypothetical protein ATJ97_3067 [Georgenia soli]|uniref:DUF4190 domain-containing protein n=1 Tax=Georgenia soli TaxID=638953 RepID=A0A2A9EN72_9MICO|nr:DUF4190 domain-containing protein [Georgenia soli]PFG40537.1 hypothetical protein ATJ97_3067 [Georgenia soli]
MSSTPPPGREPHEPGPDAAGAGQEPAGGPGPTSEPYRGIPYQGPGSSSGAAGGGGYPEPGYADADYQSSPGQPHTGAPYQREQYGSGAYGQPQQYVGTPYGGSYQGGSYGGGQGPRNGMGLAALIVAVISLVIAWVPFLGLLGGLGGLVAVVLGAVALGRANRGEATNRGTAIAAIVIGVIAILLAIASTMFGSFLLSEVFGPQFQACMEQYGDDPAALQRCLETIG